MTSRSKKQEFAAWLEALGDEPCGDNGLCPIRMWRGETRTRLGPNFGRRPHGDAMSHWKGVAHASEAQIQSAIVDWLRLALPGYLTLHIPNSPFIRARGFVTGAPDLLLVAPGGQCGFIEVKGPYGKLKSAQEDFRDRCRRLGVPWACCRSVEDVETALASWGWQTERKLL